MQTMNIWGKMLSEQMAKILREKDADQLKKWYTDIMSSDADYVVFVVRRSYVTALILEQVTGIKMNESGKRIMTDSAFLQNCDSMAEHYRKHGRFPKVMLCDDMLIHGRNLNRILENIEDRLCELLDTESPRSVKSQLGVDLRINVYCYAKNPAMILKTRYLANARYHVQYQPEDWHALSNNISSLISCSGLANASYIYSDMITSQECQRIMEAGEGFTETELQGNVELSRVQLLEAGGKIKAIATLRVILNENMDRFRVVPFVFMPNMAAEETEALLSELERKGLRKGYKQDFFDMLRELYRISGMRTFNEWISLVLSMSVLREFKKEYSIDGGEAASEFGEEELWKLYRNYRMDGYGNVREYLKQCVQTPILENTEELRELVVRVLPQERAIMKAPLKEKSVADAYKWEIQMKLEDYFYDKGYQEEEEAVAYDGLDESQFGLSRKTVRGCCFVLRELLENCSVDEVQYGMAYFQQLMDAGDLSLSSLTVRDVIVVGYAQFAKAGEQSLIIKPDRYLEYMPVLSFADEWCNKYNEDYDTHLTKYTQSEYCDLPMDIFGDLLEFVRCLKKIKQTPTDWYMDYYPRINQYMSRERVLRIYDRVRKQTRYLESYKKYLRTLM